MPVLPEETAVDRLTNHHNTVATHLEQFQVSFRSNKANIYYLHS